MTEDELINEVARRTKLQRMVVRDIVVVLRVLQEMEDEDETNLDALLKRG